MASVELDNEREAPQRRLDAARALSRRWWRSRFGYRMFLELALVAILLTLYRYGRYLAREHHAAAFHHARQVLSFEGRMGLDVELSAQRHVLEHLWVIRGLNRYYVSVHFPATVGFFAYTYLRHPDGYRRIRRLFVTVTGAALVIHVLYPLAPPRMMPGFVDTITTYGPAIYQRSDVASTANQFAAMPSLHFGWSVLVAYGVVTLTQSRWRWLIAIHPVMIFLSIVLTANHYWLDAAAAGALVLVALAIFPRYPRTAPVDLTDVERAEPLLA